MPSLLRNTTNTGTKLRQPRELAEYVYVPCMEIGYRSLVVARAWVRGKSTSNPKVNLDTSGDCGFRIFGNLHAQTWFSDAFEASLFGPVLTGVNFSKIASRRYRRGNFLAFYWLRTVS